MYLSSQCSHLAVFVGRVERFAYRNLAPGVARNEQIFVTAFIWRLFFIIATGDGVHDGVGGDADTDIGIAFLYFFIRLRVQTTLVHHLDCITVAIMASWEVP